MPKPRCQICRSRRWHRDRNSGLVVCEEGHILQGYVQEDTEAEGPSQFSTRIRRVNKRKIATWVGKTANTDFYHGQQLRYLHFQITQILLRRQTQQLMILWDLPIEFEMIVRDLWAMYISLTDLEAEPYKDVDDRGSRDGSSPDKEAAPEYHDPLAALYNALSDSASSTDSEPDATSDKSTRSESPKKSTGEATSGYGNYTSKSTRKPRKPFDPSRRLQMHYTLVICYLACLTLRLPVLMRDLLDLAASHKIAYLDILAQVPEDMRKHLETVRTADFIEDTVVPVLGITSTENSLSRSTTSMIRLLKEECDIAFPPINAPAMLWKMVEEACLPPFIYLAARRILLSAQASMQFQTASGNATELPEMSLAASVIISLKLVWGVDGTTRLPLDDLDMAVTMPRFESWLELAERMQYQLPNTAIPRAARSDNVGALDPAEMDKFFEYFEKSYFNLPKVPASVLGMLPEPGAAAIIDKYFPMPSENTEAGVDDADLRDEERAVRLEAFYSTFSTPVPGEATYSASQHPGQDVRIWSTSDEEGVESADYKRILSIMSSITGLPTNRLLSATTDMEQRLSHSSTSNKAGQPASVRVSTLQQPGRFHRNWAVAKTKGGLGAVSVISKTQDAR